MEAFRGELARAAGMDAAYDAGLRALEDDLMKGKIAEENARRLVERMAVMLQASLLLQHAPSAVSAAFCASRLGDRGGMAFGTLPADVDFKAIIERSTPEGVSR